ncbi:MFS transporter [Dyella telluris]|uniref:MFS transporter n=1 Tax=Dyella telluris TaxID=2763498 RepID=A0A7G8Q5Y6_9GAMM|nr:MFS transporter [Dyella telluris]QNK02194.1 MFS transporter [Dyella telluris]
MSEQNASLESAGRPGKASTPASAPAPSIGPVLTLAMAASCGVCVANIYYNQPLLGLLQSAFDGQAGIVDWVPTITQLGYAGGLVCVIPLGDRIARRPLIIAQTLCLVLALVLLALSPNALVLVVASALVGITASVAQQIVPFAAELANPEQRGRVVGRVMAGLLCGILFSRAFGGYIGEQFGWRAAYWCGALLSAAAAGLLWATLPSRAASTTETYATLMRSLGTLLAQEPALVRATTIQALLFGSFIAFWSILALRLEAHFHLGAEAAGAFGILGAIGVLAAPLAGRVADRKGPHLIIGLGAVVMLLSWLVFAGWPSVAGLIVGVILLDFGEQIALVSNQHVIYALRPEARSRVNTVFMGGMFVGGAFGAWGAVIAWQRGGWIPVAGLGAVLVVLALAIHGVSRLAQSRRRHLEG